MVPAFKEDIGNLLSKMLNENQRKLERSITDSRKALETVIDAKQALLKKQILSEVYTKIGGQNSAARDH